MGRSGPESNNAYPVKSTCQCDKPLKGDDDGIEKCLKCGHPMQKNINAALHELKQAGKII